jgi:subtilisin family serine protease
MARIAISIFINALVLFYGLCAWSQPLVSSKVQEHLKKNQPVDIIVYLKDVADLSAANLLIERRAKVRFVYRELVSTAEQSQAQLTHFLKKRETPYRSFYTENALAIPNAKPSLVRELQEWPQVLRIDYDASIRINPLPQEISVVDQEDRRALGPRSHIKLIQADRVWAELDVRGEGIVVAGQDTGYSWTHNAIKMQYRGYGEQVDHNYNWHDAIHSGSSRWCQADNPSPCDDTGHGTHTMGTILGDDRQGNAIGVAPEAQWIGCRNMEEGVGQVSSYLECFEFFMAPYPRGGDPNTDGRPEFAPHIVNNSWSCPSGEGCSGEEFLRSIRALRAAGIITVVAAGNGGPSCETINNPPGSYSGELISVGAYNRYTRDIAYFSSLGRSGWNQKLAPTLIAPGTLIRSAVHTGDNNYDDKSGTSMASPHVAGVVALLWSAHPELIGQVDETIRILQETAQPIRASKNCSGFPGSEIPNAVFGYGMVDAYSAIMAVKGQ